MSCPSTDFDLLTERWIPVLKSDGAPDEVGVLDALRYAPHLSRIADLSPLVTFGIHRLLAAVLHQYLPIANEDDWADLWEAEGFSSDWILGVASRCSGRMRLFDAERPLYQSADIPLSGKPAEPLKSVGYLAPEASTGTNVAHFNHAGDAHHAYCPACCAKGLIQLPCFATAGGAGIKPGINGVPPLYLLPRGENLFQTLLLNFVLPTYRGELARGADPGPLWEAETVVGGKLERPRTGFVESLSWPPRRARLFPEGGGTCSRCGALSDTLVRRMVFSQGWSRGRDLPLWRDAWVAYQRRKRKADDMAELLPIRPTEHRDVWRDFPGLFLQHDADGVRPRILDQIGGLKGDCIPPGASVTYELFGLRTDMKAKVFEWRQDTFSFPRRLLQSEFVMPTLQDALGEAEHAETALRQGLRELIPDMQFRPPDPLAYAALRAYWLGMEDTFRQKLFDTHLTGDMSARGVWLAGWRQTARAAARRQLDRAIDNFDADADALRRQVRARDRFHSVLARQEGSKS
jgi:CRISPR system Cascade subunit CasA